MNVQADYPTLEAHGACARISARIQALEPALRAKGVTGLYLFGSTVKGTRKAGSDLDFFYVADQADRGLRLYREIRCVLQELWPAIQIDLVHYTQLKDYVRPSAEAWSRRIFGPVDYASLYTDEERRCMIAKDPLPLLDIILRDLARIFELTQDMDADEIHGLMQDDDLVESRIVLNLMNIINILKNRLPQPMADALHEDLHPEAWRNMRDIRNVTAHEYFNLDLSATARIVFFELPVLHDLIGNARHQWVEGNLRH